LVGRDSSILSSWGAEATYSARYLFKYFILEEGKRNRIRAGGWELVVLEMERRYTSVIHANRQKKLFWVTCSHRSYSTSQVVSIIPRIVLLAAISLELARSCDDSNRVYWIDQNIRIGPGLTNFYRK
jgi:hypothetical protein